MKHRFTLDKTSKKFRCPGCQKKRFVRYVDLITGEYLPVHIGRCDREVNCGYNLTPKKAEYKSPDDFVYVPPLKPLKAVKKPVNYIPAEVLNDTLKGYNENVFLHNLRKNIPYPFTDDDLQRTFNMYKLGTITKGYRNGAITFPFIDQWNKCRTIQVKQFDENNHTTGTDFLHSMIEKESDQLPEWLVKYKENELKVSCLFGEHLLKKYPRNPIGLVEAPKTAVYSTLYFGFPEDESKFIWLAVYNLSSLNYDKCKVLEGREVVLFPDVAIEGRAFKLWSEKAEELKKKITGVKIHVSEFLEKVATDQDRTEGIDLADYLIKDDWRDYRDGM